MLLRTVVKDVEFIGQTNSPLNIIVAVLFQNTDRIPPIIPLLAVIIPSEFYISYLYPEHVSFALFFSLLCFNLTQVDAFEEV